ncbi:putative hydrolase [Cupriavidus taiwanensis]|uniref:Hydrolase n=2 Tax=Cupriavidus taiwanensis TaxID=164546 RepID=A0A976AZN4_9BURK|nr:putative hydrolase [Cupriavidus taiwanensis]SOZ62467.1 putative hydrolase [Cupriavidus taiwanensis]SOZ66590.1 putative hydrolase [Cupriavidus taiwanensis]SPA07666.1 putative hydrolase [Cupriavidus taiwanensis]
MRRLMFEGCAGWLHEAQGRTGVVLCAPLGHEAMWSHRAWRHLADDLAAAGMPVLRFDYPCTGDSAGACEAAHFLGRAASSIVAAAAQLRALAGVERIVLCGLRAGASLAVQAAEAMRSHPAWQGGVAALVLLAPVVNGRAYLRELRALHLNWLNSVGPTETPPPPPAGALDVLAFRFSADTVRDLEALRLDRGANCPAPRVLVLDPWPDTASAAGALARHYTGGGVQVEEAAFPEYADMMQSAEFAGVPAQAWRQLVQWLASIPAAPQAALPGARWHMWGAAQAASLRVAVDGVVEESVWLDARRQFGILCMPCDEAPAPVAVIFPNTGGNHHVGDGRMFVTLSRRLARLGVVSLRLDVSALGDSPRAPRSMSIPTIYSPGPRADVSAAVDWMRTRGFRCIVLAGVCSGAFLSLHAALANPGVNGLVLANLVKFRWDRADDRSAGKGARSWQGWLSAARRGGNWQRMLQGEVRVGPLAAAMARHAYRHATERVAFRLTRLRGGDDLASATAYARAAMRSLDERGVRTEMLYGSEDMGLEEAQLRFGRDLEALAAFTHITVHRHGCMDHALFLAGGRQVFCDQVVKHVVGRLAAMETVGEGVPRGAKVC